MKKILFGLLISTTVFALSFRTKSMDTIEGIFGTTNLIYDAGFELGGYTWTASGGSKTIINGINAGQGYRSISWDSSAAAQTLTSKLIEIPAGMFGKNAVVSCNIKTISGTATYTIAATDGTTPINPTTITSSSYWARTTVNFVMPSSANIAIQIKSVSSNEPEIYVDSCLIADASLVNLSQVNQATLYGTAVWNGKTNCTWIESTASTWTSMPPDTDCSDPTVTGNASAPGTKIPGVTFASLPPGDYVVMVQGALQSQTNGVYMRLSDGTNTGGPATYMNNAQTANQIVGKFSYTTAQSNITFQPQFYLAGAGTMYIYAESPTVVNGYSIYVYRYPSQSELAYRPEQSVTYGKNVTPGTAGCDWIGTAATTWTDLPTNASCPNATSSGIAQAPTTAKTPALKVTNIPGGAFYVYAQGLFAASAAECLFRITDGTNYSGALSSSSDRTGGIFGIFNYTSQQANLDFKIQYYKISGTDCRIYANNATGTPNMYEMGIIPVNPAITAPLLVGSVTSGSTGAERIERANISSTQTITSQSGTWISSITKNSTGNFTVNFTAGIFSSAPTCLVTSVEVSGTSASMLGGVPTTSSVLVYTQSTIGTGADKAFELMCMGPR